MRPHVDPPEAKDSAGRIVARYLRDPAGSLAARRDGRSPELALLGLGALAAGVLASALSPWAFGTSPSAGLSNAAWLVIWAAMRLVIMRIAARSPGSRAAVIKAGVPGLAPFVIAAVPPLDLAAAMLSWRLTYLGLRGLDVSRAEAATVTAWAFGGQLAVTAAAWVARGVLFTTLARL